MKVSIIEDLENGKVVVEVIAESVLTGKTHRRTFLMTKDQYNRFTDATNKELIQDIFPNYHPSDREFLISGTTEEEWEYYEE